jgi:surface antigen Omp85-like protein
MSISFRPALVLALASAAFGTRLPAQAPRADSTPPGSTVRIAAGPQYRAGWFHRIFFGTRYRKLWATPIQVEVLDLDTFAGGLHAVRRGGGQQTRSLRLEGENGKAYSFRSVNKDPSGALPPELRNTAAADIAQDQISAAHPAGALVVAPILRAAGVLHAPPKLVVLPRSNRRLGQFAEEFGGMLGTIEERPDEGKDEAGFAGAADIVSSDKLLEKLRESPNDRVDAPAYLAARLVDIYLGDWDRHRDQWRWARFGDEKPRRWVPIPRDRDQALVRYDGFLLTLARASAPQLVKFGPEYAGMLGQTWNGRDLDRWLLTGLPRPVWDSVALALQGKLTDVVIDSAVAALPAEYQPLDSARLGHALRTRRDHLPQAAARFYRHLAAEVDLEATDKDEVVTVTRDDGRFTTIALARRGEDGAVDAPYLQRRFDHRDTKEVRIHLAGGDDRVVIGGPSGGGVRLRVLADGGADSVADSSRGGRVKLYAPDGNDGVAPGRVVAVDRSGYDPHPRAVRDWGDRWLSQTWFASGPDLGVFLGTGVVFTRYGFRHDPFAQRYRLRAGWSTGASTGRADFTAVWFRENSRAHANLVARASGIEVLRFHGFGNEIPVQEKNAFYRVNETELSLAPSYTVPLAPKTDFTLGPILKYSDTDLDQDRFIAQARPYGAGRFGRLGLQGNLSYDGRNRPNAATHGAFAGVGGSFYPGVIDVEEAFGEIHAVATTYLTAESAPLEPTLSFRVGGKRVWGRFPYQEAAYIGDISTVRLGRENRYAGNASLFASTELRLFLTRFFLLAPGDFGVFGLGDVGRVYLDGEESDVWHAAVGGGIWASLLDRANTMSLALARSEERTRFYLTVGFGF